MGYRWNQPAYSLSYANRRRLEIARATATNPRLLLLDEPAAGMNPVETHEITELIAKLRTDGDYTVLVIEHDMHVVEGISDRVVALDHGIKIAEGSFDQVATDPGSSRRTWAGRGRRGGGVTMTDNGGRFSSWTRSTRTTARSTSSRGCRCGVPGRAGVPPRRQRLREVDDPEDGARDRQAADRAV